jgi:hypothetical protein
MHLLDLLNLRGEVDAAFGTRNRSAQDTKSLAEIAPARPAKDP